MLQDKVKAIKLKVKLIENGKLPVKGSEDAACDDLFARKIEEEEGDPNLYKVYLGVAFEPPPGYRIAIYPRSEISKTSWMLSNSLGVGDNDYRGEYIAYFRRINPIRVIDPDTHTSAQKTSYRIEPEFPYKEGDRCCQFELVEYRTIKYEVVTRLNETKRSTGGFGSSGKK